MVSHLHWIVNEVLFRLLYASYLCGQTMRLTLTYITIKFDIIINLKLDFIYACIDSCACFIYMQASAGGSISDDRDSADYLAHLTLQQFKFGTNMMSNGKITVRTSMQDCLLDDKRPEKGDGIARYINFVDM